MLSSFDLYDLYLKFKPNIHIRNILQKWIPQTQKNGESDIILEYTSRSRDTAYLLSVIGHFGFHSYRPCSRWFFKTLWPS